MKVLITGICGFVGSTLAKVWLDEDPGLAIYGLDNFSRPGSERNRISLQQRGIRLFHGDIRIASDFEVLPEVDWVIDASAKTSVLAGVDGQTNSRQLIENNLYGTVNILEYCKCTKAGLILLSSSRVYSVDALAGVPVEVAGRAFRLTPGRTLPPGLSRAGVAETFSTAPPISLYGGTKLTSEILALEYGETFGFPVWINRCGVLAGAGQFGTPDQGIFAYWINAWLQRRPLAYIGFGGEGFQVRDCLHPRDLIPLLRKQTFSGCPVTTRVVNIGGGTDNAMSLAELSDWCAGRFGMHSVAGRCEQRPFDVPWLVMDASLCREVFGWRPQTSLNAILEEIAIHAEEHPDWLQQSGVS